MWRYVSPAPVHWLKDVTRDWVSRVEKIAWIASHFETLLVQNLSTASRQDFVVLSETGVLLFWVEMVLEF
jgi:hypothetical protein